MAYMNISEYVEHIPIVSCLILCAV